MREWYRLVLERISSRMIHGTHETVPFGLRSFHGHGDAWHEPVVTEVSSDTVKLESSDPTGLQVEWFARVFPDTRAIECWGAVTNRGHDSVRNILESDVLDSRFLLKPDTERLWLRTVNGARHMPVTYPPFDFRVDDRLLITTHQPGMFQMHSKGDGMTSGEFIPAAIICDESRQSGLAFMLEWSGIWRMGIGLACTDTERMLKVEAGIAGLNLHLQPGETLPFPRLLITAFEGDLEVGTNSVRRHIRRHVTPRLDGVEIMPPVSFNHWFAFGNDFTEKSLKPAVDSSADAGYEYFCVDGGWFREGFRKGVGNWGEGDPAKFPNGIRPFADYVRSRGLRYGTWFEPEWANEGTELHDEHPEWFLPTPSMMVPRFDITSTNPKTHMLNLGLPEARKWWFDRFERAYSEWGMRWVRWDFNQSPQVNWDADVPVGKIGWRQIEHVLGLYRLLDDIIEAFPDLLIEQCASGGHRIDLGMARRGHTFWMNDHTTNSDIVRAMQYGLNHLFPGNYANTNLCQFRHDYSDYDFASHGMGGFGYSGRIWESSDAEFRNLREAIARFKSYRGCLMGDMHGTGPLSALDSDLSVGFSDGSDRVEFAFGSLTGRTAQIRRR